MNVPPGVLEAMKDIGNIAVLTGAGISAESGLITFRGKGGLWEKFEPDEVATPAAWEKSPLKVWKFHDNLRKAISENEPNVAHKTLAEMEKHYENFTLITQNIDQYHQDAGSKNVMELHGNAWRVKCIEDGAISKDFEVPKKEMPPYCECGALLRPDVVWFNEPLPFDVLEKAFITARECQVMLVIGTSAYVQPAALLPYEAFTSGAKILEFNLEPTSHTHLALYSFFGKVGDTLPEFWKEVRKL